MLNYEVTFIADPVLSGDEMKKTVQAYSDMLTKEGCSITNSENVGLRQLAYPINKKNSGIYHCIQFSTDVGHIVPSIELALRRDERIMRFLTVRLDRHGVKYNADKRSGKIGKSKKTVEREEEKKKEQLKETRVPVADRKPAAKAAAVKEAPKTPAPETTPTPEATPAPVKEAVDLTKIEGIGPKTAEVLVAAGIVSYTHLKMKSADDIKAILDGADAKLSHLDPTTWSKQAEYAANGEWDALKKWQDELDGGKASSSEEE